MTVSGTLVVAGDFTEAITLLVTRRRPAELGLPGNAAADAERLQEALLDDIARQPQLFNFDLRSQSTRTDAAGRAYAESEYRVAFCKGEAIEGRAGVRRCVKEHRGQPRREQRASFNESAARAMCGKLHVARGARCACRCVGPTDNVIPTPVKHAYSSAALASDGSIYIATASSSDDKWAAAREGLVAAASSLSVT